MPIPRRRLAALAAVMLLALAAPAAGRAAPAAGRAAPATGSSVSGTLTGPGHTGLPGMEIEAVPSGAGACTAAAGCVTTDSGAHGTFTLAGLAAGGYELEVVDGLQTVAVQSLTVPAPTAPLSLSLPAPAIPAGVSAHRAVRALRWLNAERRRDGVGGGVVLNPRWSQECAAHDAYEAANRTLQSTESPAATGYSLGGAWAGLSSDLAQGRWTATANPWRDAPVNLLALLAPSLSVTGIDAGTDRQCAVTFPGMLRPAPAHDTVHVVPAAGARGVPRSELARESPFTPVQFVGLPATRTTGPELFVYLNRAGELGQAPVQLAGATLRQDGHRVAVRTVGARTRTLGHDLAGAIVIPVRPLAAHTTYHATVAVRDGARTLTRAWSFQTA